jgi:hypothetical protein
MLIWMMVWFRYSKKPAFGIFRLERIISMELGIRRTLDSEML